MPPQNPAIITSSSRSLITSRSGKPSENVDPSFNKFFDESLEHIKPKLQKLIMLNEKDSIKTALDLLAEHNIMSAPLARRSDGRIKGTLGVISILRYIVSHIPPHTQLSTLEMKQLLLNGVEIGKHTMEQVYNYKYPQGCPDLSLKVNATVKELVKMCSTPINQTHLWYPHRALLLNPSTHEFTGVASQTDVMKWLIKHLDGTKPTEGKNSPLHNIAKTSLNDPLLLRLEDKKTPLVSAVVTNSVLKILDIMFTKNVSYLILTDIKGKLVGYFSARALRSIMVDKFNDFLLDCESFLKKYCPEALNPFTIDDNQTVEECIRKLASNNMHHILTVDSRTKKPVNIFSITDLMLVLDAVYRAVIGSTFVQSSSRYTVASDAGYFQVAEDDQTVNITVNASNISRNKMAVTLEDGNIVIKGIKKDPIKYFVGEKVDAQGISARFDEKGYLHVDAPIKFTPTYAPTNILIQ